MSTTLALVLTVLLLAVNAFFVAGEFATTSTRRSQVEPLVEAGARGSTQAMYALEHVSLMLAICQLGITVASTSLGVVAEPAIAHLVEMPLERIGLPAASSHAVGFTAALVLVLVAHVVLGEMVPKNVSIASPVRILLVLAPPLVALGRVLRPVIQAMDATANWFLRRLSVEPRSEISSTFTVEEVASIVELSQQEGMIEDELGLLSGTLEFSTETAETAMVPLADLVVLPRTVTPEQVEREVARTGFSRFPVSDEDGRVCGYVHLKDVLHAVGQQRAEPVEPWRIRRLESVRAGDEVEDALRHMQRTGTHCAEVKDSSGAAVGVLFLEDILEELVGEVRDSLQRDGRL
ncbi:HlyC/CorC family transporter [Schaalia sp. 19OD2882]|uniref:hemolysin family protein n=1 Tax=Schaalia sp. 19OD2882 TaxID=2794089 RepID=UPI001C1EDF5A|nr:hemolysin family protein [Schaalia sp. 19OD2882]QWW20328.1 HlyC/CorC family transporter [Schaalia sp. 19OD2882]